MKAFNFMIFNLMLMEFNLIFLKSKDDVKLITQYILISDQYFTI